MRTGPRALSRGMIRLLLLVLLVAVVPGFIGCPKSDEPAYYIKKLESSDEEVQRRAVEELVRMHKKAMPVVREALAGEVDGVDAENPNVRKGSADFFAKVRRMDSVTAAGELLDDPDKAVRLKAIEAVAKLSQVWKSRSVELLSHAFQDEDGECVKLAGEGLRDMEYEDATQALRDCFAKGETVQGMYAAKLLYEQDPEPQYAQLLVKGLLAKDDAVRLAAETNVMELKDKIARPLVEFMEAGGHTALETKRLRDVLTALRDSMITELDEILDSQRAADILIALGVVAGNDTAEGPDRSIEKLDNDLRDGKLESAWRVAAAEGLAVAAESDRTSPTQDTKIVGMLTAVLDNEKEDKRIRIGAAIALCQLRKKHAVEYLLSELDKFEQEFDAAGISEARRDDLTRLRIGAQEALVEAGDFVVPFLKARIRPDSKPGPIIIWAAVETLGELRVEDVLPNLGIYMRTERRPNLAISENGAIASRVTGLSQTRREAVSFLLADENGDAILEDWQALTDDQIEQVEDLMEPFEYPHFVRWTSALALGKIGGQRAIDTLHDAEKLEVEFLEKLRKNHDLAGYYERAPVIDALIARHEAVLFYVRKTLEQLGGEARVAATLAAGSPAEATQPGA
jgi:HEAT repeat protein